MKLVFFFRTLLEFVGKKKRNSTLLFCIYMWRPLPTFPFNRVLKG